MLEQVGFVPFGRYPHIPGTVFLTTPRSATLVEARHLACKFGGRPDATLQSHPDRVFIGVQGRARLIARLERELHARDQHVFDLKLALTRGALLAEVGAKALEELEDMFVAAAAGSFTFNSIKLRRLSSMPRGECLAFHTDEGSALTMQVGKPICCCATPLKRRENCKFVFARVYASQ